MVFGFDLSFVLFVAAAFLAVVLLLEGLWLLWSSRHGPQARRLAQRLRVLTTEPAAAAAAGDATRARAAGAFPALQAMLARRAAGLALERWIELAGLPWRAADLLAGSALLGLVVGSGAMLATDLPDAQAVLLGVLAAGVPWWWVARCRARRRVLVERQFPQALDLLARALRAGHAFSAAVRMAAEELPDPLVRDFRLLFEEMNYGLPVPEALARFARRVPLADAGYFAVAVTVQREAGGNLAEVLDKIAGIVRARLRLFGEVRTMSAEGRLSAWILSLLPFVLALVVHLVHPKFLAVLWTDPAGHTLIAAALTGIAVGVLWMRAIVRIRV
jgi:tight adherence protein B